MYTREINKYIKPNCVPSWIYLRDYTGMHCQYNIKNIKIAILFSVSLKYVSCVSRNKMREIAIHYRRHRLLSTAHMVTVY